MIGLQIYEEFVNKVIGGPIISWVVAYLIIQLGYLMFLESYDTKVTVRKDTDTITIIDEHLMCGRTYKREGKVSQLTDIFAKAVRDKQRIIGFNVYFEFKDRDPIVFHHSTVRCCG